ncbi:hypothetical protein RBB78_09405 [Tunturiibacter empetritectus]|uniref:hypothetical protein n=1 Tax=Tunturiibacter empetritectus TaxID=3069691 RepID=UPI003D9BC3B1
MSWDSATACRAATTAKCTVRSVAVRMPESRCWRASKSLTAAVWVKRRPWVLSSAARAGASG